MWNLFVLLIFATLGRADQNVCNSGAWCIPISECQEMIEIVLDDRLLKFAQSLFCGYFHEPYVCCNRDCQTPNGSYGKSTVLENCFKLKDNLNTTDRKKQKFLQDSYLNATHVCCNIDEHNFQTVPSAPIETSSTPNPDLQPLNLSCITPNGVQGVCKYVNDCEAYQNVVKETDREFQFVNDSFCGWWKEPMVCCSQDFTYTEQFGDKLSLQKCGLWANEKDLPSWLGFIETQGDFCVGALISEEYVLASTKCALSEHLSIKFGSCINDENELGCQFQVDGLKIFPLHAYVHSEDTGIALLKLNQTASGLSPICLPQTELAEHEVVQIMGLRNLYKRWEKTSWNFHAISNDYCHDGIRKYLKNIICINNAYMCKMREFRLQNLVARKEDQRWFLEGLFQEQECYGDYFRAAYVYRFLPWIKSNLE